MDNTGKISQNLIKMPTVAIKTIFILTLLTSLVYSCPDLCTCSGHSVSCPDSAVIPAGIPNNTETLSFVGHLFTNLPSYTFVLHYLCNLEMLQLEYGNLEVIDQYAFHGLPSLHLLHLRSNNIFTIHPKAFDRLSRVTILYLTGNKLLHLQPRQFDGLSGLTWLSLSSNQLQGITPNAFRGLVNLKSLYLRNNEISSIPTNESFAGLRKLTQLTLNSNQGLTYIGDHAFSRLTNLERLELSDNRISATKLTEFTFAGLESLRLLNLDDNPLFMVPEIAFKAISQLHVLYMSKASLEFIHAGAFRYLPNLMELTLDKNYRLYSIPQDCLHSMPGLQIVRLSEMNIEELHQDTFVNTSSLYRLSISRTRLSKINPGVFVNLSNIHDLDLSNNELTTLPSDIFASIPYAPSLHIDLRNNPWQCDCHLPEFLQSINKQYTTEQLKKIFTISRNQPQCLTPPHLAQTPIFTVPLANLTCTAQSLSTINDTHVLYITIGCLVSMVTMATIVAIVVFWKKYWRGKLSQSVQYSSQQNILNMPLDDDVSIDNVNISDI